MTVHRRPYKGVNVHVARRYLCCEIKKQFIQVETANYDVPNQLAWFDLLKSEDIEGST